MLDRLSDEEQPEKSTSINHKKQMNNTQDTAWSYIGVKAHS